MKSYVVPTERVAVQGGQQRPLEEEWGWGSRQREQEEQGLPGEMGDARSAQAAPMHDAFDSSQRVSGVRG